MKPGLRPVPGILAGVALLVAGGGAFLVSSGTSRASPEVLGGNRPVNIGATDPLDVTAQNSPVLRRNPTAPLNLVVANRVDSPRFSCALRTSFDGGATWAEVALPVKEGAAVACFSPDVAFGADGTLYLSYTTFGPVPGHGTAPDAIWLVTSGDGGRTLSAPSMAGGPLAFQVRLAADPARRGRLYLAWVQGADTSNWGFASVGNPVMVSRSDDGGATWRPPATASAPARERVVAPSIAVGDDGEVHVVYVDVGTDVLDYAGAHEGKGGDPDPGPWSLVAARSTDGGATWRDGLIDDGVVPTQRFLVLFPPTPSLAVHDGTVYVAFQDGRLGDPDVWLWKSTDHGRQWRRPRRVNDTPAHDRTSQYLPELAVGPGGRLDVVYYDRRADFQDRMNEVSLQSSFDGGQTFTHRLRLSERGFDSRVGVGSERGMADLGNRMGVVSTGGRALAVWTDTRGGTPASGKQDLASAVVAIGAGRGPYRAVRLAAASAAVAGLVALAAAVAGLIRRRKGRISSGSADVSPEGAPLESA